MKDFNTTHTGLWARNLDNDHGRNSHAQSVWKEDCKENTWTCKRRMMEKNDNQWDKKYVTRRNIVKFIKTLWLRRHGHAEWMQSEGMPNHTVQATMEGTRKRGIPCKWCTDKVEEDLNIIGLKNRQASFRKCQERRKIVLEAMVHNGL